MNFALSDEQELLREAARGALSRYRTIEAAREALESDGALPDLWPVAVDAGWPGLLIDEERGGAGLGTFDALLVAEETGRVLAGVPYLGVIPATYLLNAAGHSSLARVAEGELRPAYLPARPPDDLDARWTADPEGGHRRAAAPVATIEGDAVSFSGSVHWVPDAPGADLLVVVGATAEGSPAVGVVEASAARIEPLWRYDATRALAHVTLDGARAERLALEAGAVEHAWHLAQALLAAESVGTVAATLELSVAYAKERYTFGRAIGSYQAIKHELVEVLRRLENARSLQYYAGWAGDSRPEEFAIAASAARSLAGAALDYAARSNISVHGGIGATWEHDAPLYFRRAQLARRLLGGASAATDALAGLLMEEAAAAAA